MKYIIDLPDTCQWVQWINLSDKDGHAYFDFKSPEDLTPLDKELSEAYQKGLHDGKARNESGCVGCIYDDGRIDRSPCDYCCNAYSNQWMAKLKLDDIKVGDEVFVHGINGNVVVVEVDGDCVDLSDLRGWHSWYDRKNVKKTGRYFPQVAELLNAMKGEQRSCSTCEYSDGSDMSKCSDCFFSSKGCSRWEPKEGAE